MSPAPRRPQAPTTLPSVCRPAPSGWLLTHVASFTAGHSHSMLGARHGVAYVRTSALLRPNSVSCCGRATFYLPVDGPRALPACGLREWCSCEPPCRGFSTTCCPWCGAPTQEEPHVPLTFGELQTPLRGGCRSTASPQGRRAAVPPRSGQCGPCVLLLK